MGLEKKLRHPTINDRLKGSLLILAAAGGIYASTQMIKEDKMNKYPFEYQLPINPEQSILPKKYRNYKELRIVDEAANKSIELIPYFMQIGCIALGLAGASQLTNITYRKRY